MPNYLPQFEPVLDCLFSTLGSDFLANCGLVVPNFLRFISLCLHTSRANFPTRKVRKLLSPENGVWVGQVNIKNFEYVLNFSPWNKTVTFPWSFSILSSKMCSGGNGTRSVRCSGKYRSIWHMKISESQTGNFGRMERAPWLTSNTFYSKQKLAWPMFVCHRVPSVGHRWHEVFAKRPQELYLLVLIGSEVYSVVTNLHSETLHDCNNDYAQAQ